jgi:hypothetical protein
MKRLAFALLILLLPLPAFAWAPEGHAIAAAIALNHLTPQAKAGVRALLGDERLMVTVSSWADEVRDRRPETAAWHFVNIPLSASGYSRARDCADGNCVVEQINGQARALGDKRASKQARADALLFLIHFVADIHQPLHAADKDDRGGNLFTVYLNRKRTNLHHVWDQEVVSAFGSDPLAAAARIDRGPGGRVDGGAPADWANESLSQARAIYGEIRDPYLPRDYARREQGRTARQLDRAGLRLAALLNRILK